MKNASAINNVIKWMVELWAWSYLRKIDSSMIDILVDVPVQVVDRMAFWGRQAAEDTTTPHPTLKIAFGPCCKWQGKY